MESERFPHEPLNAIAYCGVTNLLRYSNANPI